ncbi:MAG: AAA family ATPase [Phycisphaeraceae bacterium]|nr:AAA family ATPase [Phycisphaeraceae bacterium]
MTEPNRLQPERILLRSLVPLVAHRAEVEQQIASGLRQTVGEAEAEARRIHAKAVEDADRELAEIDRTHAAGMDQLRARLDQLVADTSDLREKELSKFSIGLTELEHKAEQQAEEALWLSETVGESTLRKARLQHETTTKSLKSRREDLELATERAKQILARKGRTLPDPTPESAESRPAPSSTADLDASAVDVANHVYWLQSALSPFLLRGEGIALLMLVMMGAGGGVATLKGWPPVAQDVAIGMGSGFLLAMAILFGVRTWAHRQVTPAIHAFVRAVENAKRRLDSAQIEADVARDRVVGEVQAIKRRENRAAETRLLEARELYEQRRTVKEPKLRTELDYRVRKAEERRTGKLDRAEQDYQAKRKRREASRDEQVAASAARRDQVIAEAKEVAAKREADLQSRWLEEGNRLLAEARDIGSSSATDQPDWTQLLERPARESSNDLIRIGWIDVNLAEMPGGLPTSEGLKLTGETALRLPLNLDLQGVGSLVMHTTPESRTRALSTIQATMLRLLSQLPPGKVRFTMFDPVGLGQSFAGFMQLADFEPLIVGDRIWTEPRHLEQKLTDLTEHMEQVIQKYLRNQFGSIQEYNVQAGEIAEPFRFLVIADLPANFSEAAAKRLAAIVASGPRCGVFTLIMADSRARPPAWLPMADIERGAITLTWKSDRFVVKDDDYARWNIQPEQAPPDDVFNVLIKHLGSLAKDSGRVQVPFDTVAPKPAELWTRSSAKELDAPIGRAGATKIQSLVLGKGTAQHGLIAGRTGSGKSTLLHAIITSLAMWYSPEEIELYLVDFKKGVEFKTYATNQLPHARVIAVESEREFGISVLRRLDAELTKRGTIMRDLGVQDLAGYRQATKDDADRDPMPRVLLIVDEFQEFFVEDDKMAQEAMLLLDRLVRQGRAFGMHVVLGSQTIGGAYSLARSTIGQMAVRIALQCSESDSYLILSEDNPAARLLTRPGEAIYNDASGLLEGNSPFQVVWLPDDARDEKLRQVREKVSTLRRKPPPALVFEGNLPSNMERNAPLLALLSGEGRSARVAPKVWLGDAVSIKDPTSVTFRPQSGANLLIVGQSERAAFGLLAGATIALAARLPQPPREGAAPRITIIEGPSPEWDGATPLLETATRLSPATRHAAARGADEAIATVYGELERRRAIEHAEFEPIFLVVHGVHRFRSLRKAEDDYGFSGSAEEAVTKPDKQFMSILREGPTIGIHTIAWCDNVANLERAIDRRGVKEFDLRVLFQMSGADSSSLIDSPHAQALGQNRALLYSEETGTFEKFRPYAPPDNQALTRLLTPLEQAPQRV